MATLDIYYSEARHGIYRNLHHTVQHYNCSESHNTYNIYDPSHNSSLHCAGYFLPDLPMRMSIEDFLTGVWKLQPKIATRASLKGYSPDGKNRVCVETSITPYIYLKTESPIIKIINTTLLLIAQGIQLQV